MADYQYDVALSFLAKDEPLATRLANILEERHKVFIYSRQQEKLAGADGEKIFNDVFSKQARAVVVLYRDGWGQTAWTRIEETAIRNRAFEEGHEFALWAPVDDNPSVPIYVPKNRIWIGVARFGVAGTAAAIDARLQELGALPRVLTLEERAVRVQQAAEFDSFREGYHRSHDGIRDATASYEVLMATIEARVAKLQAAAPGLRLTTKRHQHTMAVLGTGPALRLNWRHHFANSFTDAALDATIWTGHPPMPGVITWGERHPTHSLTLTPDVNESRTFAWRFKTPEGERLGDADAVSEYLMSWWLSKAEAVSK